ncbi:unnamed protein product [Agarophyton chilense]
MSAFIPPYLSAKRSAVLSTRTTCNNSFTKRLILLRNHRRAQHQRPETHTRRIPPFAPICFNDGPGGDDDEDEEDDLQVTLRDPATRRSITVGIEEEFDFDGKSHILCYPIDDPVALVENNHDGKLHPILDDDKIADLYPSAKAVCAERHIELKNTAYIMTLEDEREFADEDESEFVDEDDLEEEKEEDDEDDEDDDHSVEVIAEFSHKEKEYMVIRPFQTIWLVASENNGTYMPIRDEQLEIVRPTIEKILAERDLSQ